MTIDHLSGGLTTDPRVSQSRLATRPNGEQVWVEITGDDRLGVIKRLPGRWPDVIIARERGDSIEQIHRWAKVQLNEDCQGECDPPCLMDHIATCYAWLETELHDLAALKAKWL